jgi:hypothetical protein
MPLTRDQIDRIKRETETQDQAAADLVKNVTTIWKSQLDMALEAGDENVVGKLLEQRATLAAQAARYNDTNCACK